MRPVTSSPCRCRRALAIPRLPKPGALSNAPKAYDILPDGRFVSVVPESELADSARAPRREIIVVQNWFEELRRLAPVN